MGHPRPVPEREDETEWLTEVDEKMVGLTSTRIEVDEVWGFIGKKNKRADTKERAAGIGDVWTWVALDPDSKVVPSFVVGKRDSNHAKALMADLAPRLKGRVQLSTNGLGEYQDAVERAFGSEVDYGQVVKTYSVTNLNQEAASRYSPEQTTLTSQSNALNRQT